MSTDHIHDAYQAWTRTTAIYPAPQAAEYLGLALCEEVGEVVEAFHPFVPFTYDAVTHKVGPKVLAELGDVMWYVARTADEIGVQLSIISHAEFEHEASIPSACVVMVMAASKIAGRRKKQIRDGATWGDEKKAEVRDNIIINLGTIIACVRVLARFFDSTIEGVMHANQRKLEDRKSRDALHGDGDNR